MKQLRQKKQKLGELISEKSFSSNALTPLVCLRESVLDQVERFIRVFTVKKDPSAAMNALIGDKVLDLYLYLTCAATRADVLPSVLSNAERKWFGKVHTAATADCLRQQLLSCRSLSGGTDRDTAEKKEAELGEAFLRSVGYETRTLLRRAWHGKTMHSLSGEEKPVAEAIEEAAWGGTLAREAMEPPRNSWSIQTHRPWRTNDHAPRRLPVGRQRGN